jgi:putative flavoprotein involved in K+ transport
MNGFPFLPFPKHFPEYLPKDLIGDWLDMYARYLDLNIWTSTFFKGAQYDEATKSWKATLRLKDGTERVMRPRHIILATGGIGGKPNVPKLSGLESFKGKVVHSTQYNKAADYGAKKAIVIGTGASGHDISVDLYRAGVSVTMLQRDPIVVNNVDTANLAYIDYINPEIPTELVDLRYGLNLISPLREAGCRKYHQFAKARDAELLKGLEAAGMRLNDGHEGLGWLDLFLRYGGGYYLNKCTSEIIVEGGIKVEQLANVESFAATGAQRIDGSILEADLVVLATGYQNRQVEVAEWFGNDVAERVGKVAVLDSEGEWANIWGQTGQHGLWFNGGGINQVRPGSERLALLIKADLSGYISEGFRRPPKNSGKKAAYEPAQTDK